MRDYEYEQRLKEAESPLDVCAAERDTYRDVIIEIYNTMLEDGRFPKCCAAIRSFFNSVEKAYAENGSVPDPPYKCENTMTR